MKTWTLHSCLLLVAILASGCGALQAEPSTATSTSTDSTLSISSFYPASGTLTAQPTTIEITFNESILNPSSATALTNYTINCGSSSAYATSVSYSAGASFLNVTVPPLTVSQGQTCSFIVGSLTDENGSGITGAREADYVISSTSSSFTWSEQSATTYFTSFGGPGGTSFNQAAASGLALSSFNIYVNGVVQGVQGGWLSSAGVASTGPFEGVSSSSTTLACPAGERMTGIFGYYSTYVNGVGIYCNNSSMTAAYTSSLAGEASGTYFSESCTDGQYATTFYGQAGSYVDQMGIGCR